MQRLWKGLPALGLVAGLAMLCAAPLAHATDPDPNASKPESGGTAPGTDSKDTSDKPAAAQPSAPSATPSEPGKSETTAPATGDAEQAVDESGVERRDGVKIQALLAEGFEIKATELVAAEIVTRQLGTTGPDAVVVTLQKESAIAVCYYTLKSYVKLRLTDLKNCTVFR